MAGIPVKTVSRSEVKKLMGMEKALKTHVYGQEEAIEGVVAAIKEHGLVLVIRTNLSLQCFL